MITVENQPTKTEQRFSDKKIRQKQNNAFLQHLFSHWVQIAICLSVFVLLGLFFAKGLPPRTNKYYISMTARTVSSELVKLRESETQTPIWQRFAEPTNQELYKILGTTSTVELAGRALNYQVRYWMPTLWGKRDVWGERPIDIYFLTADMDEDFSMTVSVQPDGVTLSGFKKIKGASVFVPYGTPTNTPAGEVLVEKVVHEEHEGIKPIEKLIVTKSNDYDARVHLDANFEQNIGDDILSVKVESNLDRNFMLDFLSEVISVSENRLKDRYRTDLMMANESADSALLALENEVQMAEGDRISLMSRFRSHKAENEFNLKALDEYPLVYVLDDPHLGHKGGGYSLYLIAVFLLLGLALPVLYYYIKMSWSGKVLLPEEAERALDLPVLSELPNAPRKAERAFDLLAIRLEREVPLLTPEPRLILVISAEQKAGVSYTAEQLAKAFVRRGIKATHAHYKKDGIDAGVAMEGYIVMEVDSTEGSNDAWVAIGGADYTLLVVRHLKTRISTIEKLRSLCLGRKVAIVYNRY